uniref:Uncharacterized protein n=1 Tax=Anguilla anguilla TaxID=7936 RepID=A0A0E9RQD4_ANGAN
MRAKMNNMEKAHKESHGAAAGEKPRADEAGGSSL